MNSKLKAALAAAKKSAGHELGILAVMVVFGVAAAIVATPVIFVMSYLPDWSWLVLLGCGFVWMVFGETISAAVSAYRGEKS